MRSISNTVLLFIMCGIVATSSITICNMSSVYDKWVVITSINHPTKAVKKLANLPDWHVVVVGDKKTPHDWKCDNCIYLSPEAQLSLNYHITRLLPWNHYCRKAIGYLYAIEHGAQIIYDTDDDNILIDTTVHYKPAHTTMLTLHSPNDVVNPYSYYGQTTVWPRGYPLKMVLAHSSYSLKEASVNNYIQQGLANEDPDVDALFRLTRGELILFEQKKPISYAPGTMSPFNSQNTIFFYPAFWTLLLPITTSFRVCDIWRGYYAQRLLWDIGGTLSFIAPTVYQQRNDHDLLLDFTDEIDLYLKSGNLVSFLLSWKSEKDTLTERCIELTKTMIMHGFYKKQELDFTLAWLQDLTNIGYQFPEVQKK